MPADKAAYPPLLYASLRPANLQQPFNPVRKSFLMGSITFKSVDVASFAFGIII